MMSRPPFSLTDVATTRCCRDLFSFAHDVATADLCRDLLSCQLMSRHLTDVATLISLQDDVTTACDALLMSRPHVFFFLH